MWIEYTQGEATNLINLDRVHRIELFDGENSITMYALSSCDLDYVLVSLDFVKDGDARNIYERILYTIRHANSPRAVLTIDAELVNHFDEGNQNYIKQ